MTLLYSSPEFLDHDTGDHPECAGRLLPTMRLLHKSSYLFPLVRPSITPISARRLSAVHPLPYVESLRNLAEQGGEKVDEDTIISPKSLEVASLAAGAVCDAVERVVQGDDKHAFCLIRPPGHHALPSRAMGFCLFANVALGARVAIDELSLDRVLIVDWDVHHGNGTQAIFWEDAQVGFLSIHRYPFYPGSGAADETGAGSGLATTLNVPIKVGTPRTEYLEAFTAAVERFADRIKPQLVMISAGFDAHRLDPFGSLGLESEDFAALTRVILDVARVHAGGRVVSVLEGGYHPAALAESIEFHLHEMSDD